MLKCVVGTFFSLLRLGGGDFVFDVVVTLVDARISLSLSRTGLLFTSGSEKPRYCVNTDQISE